MYIYSLLLSSTLLALNRFPLPRGASASRSSFPLAIAAMNLIPLGVIRQFFTPYWNSLGRPILEAADAAGKLIPLMEAVCPHIIYLVKCEEKIKALTDAMDRLKARRDGIIDAISIAERAGKRRTPEIGYWFKRVEAEAAEEAEFKEACRKRKRVGGHRANCISRYTDGKKATKKARVLDELQTEASSIVITRRLPPSSVREMPNIPGMVGMESYMNRVMRHLADDSMGIIAIWGMGGVGKTTLLSRINNCFLPGSERSSEFDHVIWMVAPKGRTLEGLQNGIAQKLGLNLEDPARPPNSVLFDYLRGKKFLLLLDDLWRGFELEDVGIPRPDTGGNQFIKRKVIITTRLQDVCGKMGADAEIKVTCLEQTEAWDLFKTHVGNQTLISHPDIHDLARDVVEKCKGLPLALKTIGRSMRTRREPKHWRHTIKLLREAKYNEIQGLEIQPEEGDERDMFRILKPSYDHLRDDRMKQCFLSCCLWPEGHPIKKVELIECWMGLGLIDVSYGNSFWGEEHIRILEGVCLLEPDNVEDTVKMHDVFRNLAQWIASDCGRQKKWVVQAGVGLKEAIDVAEKWTEVGAAERISLMRNQIEMLPQHRPYCRSLQILMLQVNTSLGRIPPTLFQCMPALTYLDLSQTILKTLPKGISRLVHLHFLNLSWTQIQALQKELACLKELKYLLLRHTTHLSSIPHGVISNLSNLRQLDLYGTKYVGWEVEGSRGNEELGKLNSNVMSRITLGITVDSVGILQKLSKLDKMVTQCLCIKGMSSSASIQLTRSIVKAKLGSLKMLQSLQKLKIESCQSLVELELDGEDQDHDVEWRLPKLEDLILRDLKKLKVVKWMRGSISCFFPQLRAVRIKNCNELKNANWVLHLPRLESLEIEFCPKMQQVIGDSVDSHIGDFRCLKMLFLYKLECLSSICTDQTISFSSLELIDVKDCDQLKQLPRKIMESNLQEIRGSKQWWQSLQDEDVRASLLPHFKENY